MSDTSKFDNVLAGAVLSHLQSEHVVAEYNRRPQDQQPQFMMAYAGYLMWLTKVGAEKHRKPQEVETLVRTIHREFAQLDWYQPGLFERVWDELQIILPEMRPGPTFGVLIPLTHVIMAANFAGCHLDQSTDMYIMTDSVVVVSYFSDFPVKKWWQFWKSC